MSNSTSSFPSSSSTVPDSLQKGIPRSLLVIILVILSFGTVFGNGIICLAIKSHPALRHVTYLSIFSLAIADLLVGLIAVPSYIAKKFEWNEPIQTIVCDIFRASYFLTGYASILSLCVISVDRLIAIRKPLDYVTIVTQGRVVLALIIAWIDALVVSSLPFVPWDSNHPHKECNYEPTRWWSIMVIIGNVVFPFLVIVVCYSYMYLTAKSHMKKMATDKKNISHNETLINGRKERNERRGNITIMIVIGVFVACWFPSCLYYFLQKICSECFPESFHSRSLVNAFVKVLTFTSSFVNPLIYCWRSREFRSVFIRIFIRKKRRFSESMTHHIGKHIMRRYADQRSADVTRPGISKKERGSRKTSKRIAESAT